MATAFVDWVRTLLGGDGEDRPPRAARAPKKKGRGRQAGAKRSDSDSMAFMSELAQVLKHQGEIPVGSLNIIGLHDLRERLGGKWQRLEDHIHFLARRTIEKHLGSADVYTRCADLEYLIVFASLTDEVAQLKCAKIAAELHSHLLGHSDLKHVQVRSIVGVVDGQVLTEGVSVEQATKRLADRVRQQDEVQPAPSAPADASATGAVAAADSGPETTGRPAARVAPLRKTAVTAPTTAAGEGEDDSGAVPPPTLSPLARKRRLVPAAPVLVAGESAASSGAQAEPAIREIRTDPVDASEADDLVKECPELTIDEDWRAKTDFIYRPIWDVQRSVISTFLCTPRLKSGRGTVYGDAVVPDPTVEEDILRLDLMGLGETLTTAAELMQNGYRFLVAVPVHYETLASRRTRGHFVAACAKIPKPLRRYLVFMVSALPSGVPSTRLAEIGASLAAHSRFMILAQGLSQRDFSAAQGAGFNVVCADITKDGRPEKAIIEDMNGFAQAADRGNFLCHLHGARSSSLALAAIAAGFHYIDGDRVKGITEFPEHLSRYDWSRFYGEFLRD